MSRRQMAAKIAELERRVAELEKCQQYAPVPGYPPVPTYPAYPITWPSDGTNTQWLRR